MTTNPTYSPGQQVWIELTTNDLGAATSFYSNLFGWGSEDTGEESGHYTLIKQNGLQVGGISPMLPEGQPPAWLTYVGVDSADETIARVDKAGGTVFMPPMDVMDLGRMAVFADPTGAALACWEPRAHKGAEIVNEPGAWTWSELNTRDTKTAKAFYGDVFGWEPNTFDMPEGGQYTEWKMGDKSIGGMMDMPAQIPAEVPAHWLVYFAVSDTDASVSKAQQIGGGLLAGPMDIMPGRFAVLMDPRGAAFAVLQTRN